MPFLLTHRLIHTNISPWGADLQKLPVNSSIIRIHISPWVADLQKLPTNSSIIRGGLKKYLPTAGLSIFHITNLMKMLTRNLDGVCCNKPEKTHFES